MSPQKFAASIVSFALAALFLWTSFTKLADSGAFMKAIGDYGLVWEPLLGLAAWGVIGAELVAAVGLGLRRRWGAGMATGLLVVFLGVLGYGIGLGLDIECGCFGTGGESKGLTLQQAFGLDLVLLAVSGWLWWTRPAGSETLDSRVDERPEKAGQE